MKTVRGIAIALALTAAAAVGAMRFAEARQESGEAVPPGRAIDPTTVAPTVVGMNLGIPAYWSAEWAFTDLVKLGAAVRYVDPKGGWPPASSKFSFDASGHPIDIPQGTKLAIILQKDAPRLPVGRYECSITEGWDVQPWGDWEMRGAPPRFTMIVPDRLPHSGITLLVTARKNHARLDQLSCLRQGPGSAATFNPAFLDDVRPFRVVRFMDWMSTNNAPARTWAARATPASFSQNGPDGVSVEHMVALANELDLSPWFTMPFDADPGYYRAFATYVRDHLAKRNKVYVEFSNEVWNESFQQGRLASKRGNALYPGTDNSTGNDYYYADRVRAVMKDWSDVFAGQTERLVRVASAQSVVPDRTQHILSHAETWRFVDAVAIAPYFGVPVYSLPGTGARRVDAAFDEMSAGVDQAIGYAREQKKVAARFGLPLIAYEAGQHIQGFQPEIAADMLAVNRDSRIADAYRLYLSRWQKEIGGLIVLFDSVSSPGVGSGQFGHREWTGQPLTDAPKARAVEDFIRSVEALKGKKAASILRHPKATGKPA